MFNLRRPTSHVERDFDASKMTGLAFDDKELHGQIKEFDNEQLEALLDRDI